MNLLTKMELDKFWLNFVIRMYNLIKQYNDGCKIDTIRC